MSCQLNNSSYEQSTDIAGNDLENKTHGSPLSVAYDQSPVMKNFQKKILANGPLSSEVADQASDQKINNQVDELIDSIHKKFSKNEIVENYTQNPKVISYSTTYRSMSFLKFLVIIIIIVVLFGIIYLIYKGRKNKPFDVTKSVEIPTKSSLDHNMEKLMKLIDNN